MRLFKIIMALLRGGMCYKCKYYSKPYKDVDAGYCTRWHTKMMLDEDTCFEFEEMERKGNK